ncbi:MAG: type II toxin-antitoxin system VapC family toxin [Candidatus Sumerlaeaceae bacterium]|nr:type II toxin-antitoxin system VapC family toxin [Candidatus Sumerlaeaceae bacterium]
MNLTGLDTNVLVRYLVQDDAAQAKTATSLIEKTSRQGGEFVVNAITLCELVWVLESAYSYSRGQVSHALENILRTAQFVIPDRELAVESHARYQKGRGDFADYFISCLNDRHGAKVTLTFDRALKGDPRFQVL